MLDNQTAKSSGDGLILDPRESGLTVLLMLIASILAAVVALNLFRVYFDG